MTKVWVEVEEEDLLFQAPVWAEITQISPNGLVLIDFNDTVVVPKNFTNLTEDIFSVVFVQNSDEEAQTMDYNLTSFTEW